MRLKTFEQSWNREGIDYLEGAIFLRIEDKLMKELFENNRHFIYGILAIICATLSICFSTIAHFVSEFIIVHWIFELIAIFMYYSFYNGMKKQNNQKVMIQCLILNYILFVVAFGILVRWFSLRLSENGTVYLVSIVLFSLGILWVCISDYFFDRKNIGDTLIIIGLRIKSVIKGNITFEIFAFISVLIAILCSGNQPRWDGAYLFRYLSNCSIYSIFYIPQLSFISCMIIRKLIITRFLSFNIVVQYNSDTMDF